MCRLRLAAVLLGIVVLTCLAYAPGLSGGFLFDDEASIERNSSLAMQTLSAEELWRAAWSGHTGPLRRPISMASFALNHYFHGLDPFHFKITNLLVHLATGLSLAWLAWLLLRAPVLSLDRSTRAWVAVAAAAAWLVHPFNLSGVLYIVQRMTSLSALFTCWGIVFYTTARLRQLDGHRAWPWLMIGTPLAGVLAALSKENGVLLPLYCLVVEFTLFRFRTATSHSRRLLIAFFVAGVAVPLLLAGGFLIMHPDWVAGAYGGRDFGLAERLMTQARVVLWYLYMILLPQTSQMALLLDDIAVSRSLIDPVSTLPAILAVAGAGGLALVIRRRLPMLSLGILWFLCGHALESTVWPLEIAYEHRNYLPSYGVLLAAVYYLLYGARFVRTVPARRTAAVVLIALLAVSTHARAQQWSTPARLILTDVLNHPGSPRNNYFAGRYLTATARRLEAPAERQRLINAARSYYETAYGLKPRMAAARIALICLHAEFDLELPPLSLEQLQATLHDRRPLPSSINAMAHLSKCALAYPKTLSEENYLKLVDSLLANPAISANSSALVLGFVAEYHERAGDGARAIETARRAMAMAPAQLGHRAHLVGLLQRHGRGAAARSELQRLGALARRSPQTTGNSR